MDCRNWAMICIQKIQAWSHDKTIQENVVASELSSQAADLAGRLRLGLKMIPKASDTQSLYEQECELVTEVYALSALIYLAVVISGNSHLPEVRAVRKKPSSALGALRPYLLIRVSWPSRVVGFMAANSEHKAFKEILSTVEASGLGTCWNGLHVMEAFWTLRNTLDDRCLNDGYSWAVAMKHMGLKILLISGTFLIWPRPRVLPAPDVPVTIKFLDAAEF